MIFEFQQYIETSIMRLYVLYDLSIHPLEFNSSRMIENRIIIARLGVRSMQSKGCDDYDILNYVGKVHNCSISNPRDIMKRCTSLGGRGGGVESK